MDRAMKILLAAALAATMSGAAMASHICAYVNDNVNGPNAAEGYMIGPGDATVHVGPYSTNGSGIGFGFFSGGLGATRVRQSDLYVSDAASENITHFTINKTDCSLTLDTTLYPSGDTGAGDDLLAITPDGSTMFVGATGDDNIYSHKIAANGSLGPTFMEGSGVNFPAGIEVSPDGTTLVVSYNEFGQVCAFPIKSGHLGKPNCQRTAAPPAGISIDPAGACVYAGEANMGGSQVAALTLAGGILGAPTDYFPFGPGRSASGILANRDNKEIYVTNDVSAQVTTGLIGSGCKLTYKTIMSDGVSGVDNPSQIAQAKTVQGYVVTGDVSYSGMPTMGIFRAHANGKLTPIGSGQFPLMSGNDAPSTVVIVDSE